MGNLKVIWSLRAKAHLKYIFEYIKYKKKSLHGAQNVKADILKASKSLQFAEQYQKDEIQPEYCRIIVRHYKLLYKIEDHKIIILSIFDTYQNTDRQVEDDY